MIRHHAPGMDNGAVTEYRRFEIGEKLLPVFFALKNVFLLVATAGHMVVSAGE
jgi:hypothetical protein